MKRFLKWVGGIFVFLVLVGMIFGGDDQTGTKQGSGKDDNASGTADQFSCSQIALPPELDEAAHTVQDNRDVVESADVDGTGHHMYDSRYIYLLAQHPRMAKRLYETVDRLHNEMNKHGCMQIYYSTGQTFYGGLGFTSEMYFHPLTRKIIDTPWEKMPREPNGD